MKNLLLVIFCVMTVVALTGCETVKGVGQDIKNTGQNLKDLAS